MAVRELMLLYVTTGEESPSTSMDSTNIAEQETVGINKEQASFCHFIDTKDLSFIMSVQIYSSQLSDGVEG